MMNMQNQGSKENLGVKFKEGICAKLCLKLWFESGWFFVILPSQDGLKATAQKKSQFDQFDTFVSLIK